MKTRKKNNNRHNGIPYTPGRNMYGQKAETHLIVLKRETAFQQMLDAILQLDHGDKEFTFDMRCFVGHEEELNALMAKIEAIMSLKAQSRKPLCA